MKCFRCGSERMMRFVDGFGKRRIYCKSCNGSFLANFVLKFNEEKNRKLEEFGHFGGDLHQNS